MYSVPLVPPDLRHEETIVQAINSLDYLQKTIADIFDRIDARIEQNHVKIRDLGNRIKIAHNSINSLSGINKAIKIFSPAKFPSLNVFADIPKTFNGLKGSLDFDVNRDYEIQSIIDPVSHRNIQDKIVFYHVRTNIQAKNSISGRIMNQKQGLGKIPKNIKSANSLLQFNSNHNVYKKGGGAENSLGRNNMTVKKEKTSPVGQKIEAPPLSMTSRNFGDKKPNPSLFYSPQLNEAPALDVPMDLPDLPGIADDIAFSSNENERIEPPFYVGNIPNLMEPENISTKENNHETNTKTGTDTFSLITSDPPPPPPQLFEANEYEKKTAPVQPPLPPPPPAPPTTSPQEQTKVSAPSTTPSNEIGDARMNLMEAIRKAGGARGAKLRTAAAAEVTKPREDGLPKATNGNLMADLHNKLLMRRKGISGAKEQDSFSTTNPNSSSGSVMNRLSALIPPPPQKIAPVATSSATDASDENDEWTD